MLKQLTGLLHHRVHKIKINYTIFKKNYENFAIFYNNW